MRLDAAQLAFLGGLGKSPTGQQLKMLIQLEIADCNEQLRKAVDMHAILREQGKALWLDEFARRLEHDPQPSQLVKRFPRPFPTAADN